jgi:hypothetical protein
VQRADQDRLLRWAVALLDEPQAPAPDLPAPRFRAAGVTSGLTALVASRAAALPEDWHPFAREQRAEVRRRQARFGEVLPVVLATLARAGVPAIPVKGAVLAAEIWPDGSARPMADLDLLVHADSIARADAALTAAGTRLIAADDHEHVHLAWGDGSRGRTDGESAEHNGKVELHPGWSEVLYGMTVHAGALLWPHATPGALAGQPCLRLGPGAFAAHVLGHIAAAAVRAEVRALHVIDAVLVLRSLAERDLQVLGALVHTLDPRLAGPGLWLVRAYAPDVVPEALATTALARLPVKARRRLAELAPHEVLRAPGTRTDRAWRRAFTLSTAERLRIDRQLVWPSVADLRGGQEEGSVLRLRVARVGRSARRAVRAARTPPLGRS